MYQLQEFLESREQEFLEFPQPTFVDKLRGVIVSIDLVQDSLNLLYNVPVISKPVQGVALSRQITTGENRGCRQHGGCKVRQ